MLGHGGDLLVLRLAIAVLLLLAALPAQAGPSTTRDALDRLEEILQLRLEDGRIQREQVVPAIVVSTRPRYEETAPWYGTEALDALQGAFGTSGLRLCEACMAPRAFVADGQMVYQTGPVGLDEVVRLDEQARGDATPARTAIWLDETAQGVSARIVDLRTGGIVFAQNVDPLLGEHRRTHNTYSLAAEMERRARGQSLTQAFVDATIYPGQHFSLDWTDQWGKRNGQLSGVTLSLYDPVVGLGGCHYTRIPFFDTLVGGKLILSLPTALGRTIDPNLELIDPPLTAVGMIRVPFGRSNYGAILSLSTNGEAGIGISLMNISLLPVIL